MGKEPDCSVTQRQLSAAVLVGGESRRMGTDKAFIDFDGKPLVVHIVERLRTISDDVFVVGKSVKRFEALRVRCETDGSEEHSPLYGVLAALRAAKHESVFVCGCDMPSLDTSLIVSLADRANGVDAAVPSNEGRVEPLHAVWSRNATDRIEAIVSEGVRAVHDALDRLDVSIVDVDNDRSFTNVNTPADLDRLRRSG